MCENLRMPEIWRQIKEYGIDFCRQSVLDLCGGYGDFCLMAKRAGAEKVVYMDNDRFLCEIAIKRFWHERIDVVCEDVQNYTWCAPYYRKWDIISCMSALPYILSSGHVLSAMSNNGKISIIECQYNGDGPGYSEIKNDEDMRTWLSNFWSSVIPIGKTFVEGRNKYRTIWVCN